MTEALVNPQLLVWARERARLDDGAMATALKVPRQRVTAWQLGRERPTVGQAEKWARLTHVPFGVLYAPQPPSEDPLPPDFRTVDGKEHEPSPAFRDLYDDVLFKHAWYREHRRSEGFPPLEFVGSRTAQVTPSRLARSMRDLIGVDRTKFSAPEAYYRALIAQAEAAGVWVMRSGTVAGNTSRAVKPDEFRGFAIADRFAPLVFINAADSVTAQIFTLAHELAHLWLGKTGVSDPLAPTRDAAERLCNATAAEFLVPGEELAPLWRKTEPPEEQFTSLAKTFRVSPAVVAIRAQGLDLVARRVVDLFLEKQRAVWNQRGAKKGGGNFYTTLLTRNGRPFTRAVLSAALSQDLLLRDAGQLLNVNASKVLEVARREGVGS